MLALQQGNYPIYFRDNLANAERTLAAQGLNLKRSTVPLPACVLGLPCDLREIFLDVMALCYLMNHEIQPSSLDLVTYQDILLSVFYRLLRLRSLNEARQIFDEYAVIHFGLVLFAMTVLLHHGARKVIDFHLASECLQHILDNSRLYNDDDSMLWLLVIGGIWTSDTQWISLQSSQLLKHTSCTSWTNVKARLVKYPWIRVLHDKAGEEFWDKLRIVYR